MNDDQYLSAQKKKAADDIALELEESKLNKI
jgi:hypothetical protein